MPSALPPSEIAPNLMPPWWSILKLIQSHGLILSFSVIFFPTVSITVLNSEVVELMNAYYIRKVDGKLHRHHLLVTTLALTYTRERKLLLKMYTYR